MNRWAIRLPNFRADGLDYTKTLVTIFDLDLDLEDGNVNLTEFAYSAMTHLPFHKGILTNFVNSLEYRFVKDGSLIADLNFDLQSEFA